MVPRCGYYINESKVSRKIVYIDWNLGFTREAKIQYVRELHNHLNVLLPGKRCVEVTSASSEEYGRALSPLYINTEWMSLEDLWHASKKTDYIEYSHFRWGYLYKRMAFAHFYCWYAQELLPLIRLIDVFTDVFYNPKKEGMTQAEPCAILKLLDKQGNLDVLKNINEFVIWYKNNLEDCDVLL